PGGCALRGIDERSGHVLDAHDVPPVLSRTDHGEPPGLLEPLDEPLLVPAARPVYVTGADDHVVRPRVAYESLALLLGAPVSGLDRQRRALLELRAARVASHHRRGEDEARSSARGAGREQ